MDMSEDVQRVYITRLYAAGRCAVGPESIWSGVICSATHGYINPTRRCAHARDVTLMNAKRAKVILAMDIRKAVLVPKIFAGTIQHDERRRDISHTHTCTAHCMCACCQDIACSFAAVYK